MNGIYKWLCFYFCMFDDWLASISVTGLLRTMWMFSMIFLVGMLVHLAIPNQIKEVKAV